MEGKSFAAHRKTSQSFIIENRRLNFKFDDAAIITGTDDYQATGINRQSGFHSALSARLPE